MILQIRVLSLFLRGSRYSPKAHQLWATKRVHVSSKRVVYVRGKSELSERLHILFFFSSVPLSSDSLPHISLIQCCFYCFPVRSPHKPICGCLCGCARANNWRREDKRATAEFRGYLVTGGYLVTLIAKGQEEGGGRHSGSTERRLAAEETPCWHGF